MKRSNDQQTDEQDIYDTTKRQRYTQSDYGDVYAQYGMMSQYAQAANPFAQPAAQSSYAGYTQPMYGMYGAAQGMMAPQYAGGYPQQFPTGTPTFAPTGQNKFGGEASRTVYLGNVTKNIQPHEILHFVRTGMLESYRPCYEKSCAFLTFIDPSAALAFYQEYSTKKIIIHDTEIKLGWGKPTMLKSVIRQRVQAGASRCVYLGRLTEIHTEEFISNAAKKYGPIESVKLMTDRNIAFVHFLNINNAAECIEELNKEPEWAEVKVNYGKDHCTARYDFVSMGFQPFSQQMTYDAYGGYNAIQTSNAMAPNLAVLRTLYIGNIHPDAKTEDLCNSIRGGCLLQIRYLADKHIAFVTFLDASTALSVYNYAQNTGISIRGRKLRVGWGKPSSISLPVSQAISQGATRNIYIGLIPDSLTEEKIRKDFSAYGEIELVNTYREKKCAFVNFTSISNAVAAITAMRMNPEYSNYRLNYGKDRCGNAFKARKESVENSSTINVPASDEETRKENTTEKPSPGTKGTLVIDAETKQVRISN